jgi:hypothetical protein
VAEWILTQHPPQREIVSFGGLLHKRDEIIQPVISPLRGALAAMGGPDAILNADGLKLVSTKLPANRSVLPLHNIACSKQSILTL